MHESLFSTAGSLALAGWIALAVVPLRYRIARPVAIGVALMLAALYVALILSYWSSGAGDFRSLAGVARLFEHPGLLLAGWVHYLAFDLLVGTWEREEAHRIGLAQWVLVPCLVLTFLFGPLGWAAFLACRTVRLDTAHKAAPVRP